MNTTLSCKLTREMAEVLSKQIEEALPGYVARINETTSECFIGIWENENWYQCLMTVNSFSEWYAMEKMFLWYAENESHRAQSKEIEAERVKQEALKFEETMNTIELIKEEGPFSGLMVAPRSNFAYDSDEDYPGEEFTPDCIQDSEQEEEEDEVEFVADFSLNEHEFFPEVPWTIENDPPSNYGL